MNLPGKMVPHMMKMLGKKVYTVSYPFTAAQVQDKFRGMLKFNADLCNGCKLCMRFCPADAILIELDESLPAPTAAEGAPENCDAPKNPKRYKAKLYLDKCIFCGQCVDSCRRKSLENLPDFELACDNRDALEIFI